MVEALPCSASTGRALFEDRASLVAGLFDRIPYDAANDRYFDNQGCEVRQLPQEFPFLKYFYHPWEMRFNATHFANFTEQNMALPFFICAAYVAFLYIGNKVMADRAPIKPLSLLRSWNYGLAIFSLIGFLRTAPHLIYYMYQNGFYAAVCAPGETKNGLGASGLWTMLFVFSKIPELGDTVFLVLEKKPVIFLHWYHHVTVLLYCWHSYATRSSAGIFFISMNYGVHALMYYYFALMVPRAPKPAPGQVADPAAKPVRPKKIWWAPIVTTLQISQMFVGMFICGAVYYFEAGGRACDIVPENYWSGFVMYTSYAWLFIVFAFGKYILGVEVLSTGKSPRSASSTTAAAAAPTTGVTEADARKKKDDDADVPAPASTKTAPAVVAAAPQAQPEAEASAEAAAPPSSSKKAPKSAAKQRSSSKQ